MDIKTTDIIFSAFFANEFFVNLAPEFVKQETFISVYREDISSYVTSITAFGNQHNPAYTELIEKCLRYFDKHGYYTTYDGLVAFYVKQFVTSNMWSKFSENDRRRVFRQFVIQCVENYKTQAIALIKEYAEIFMTPKKTKFKQGVANEFCRVLETIKHKTCVHFSAEESGVSIQSLVTESSIVTELKQQIEDLQYELLKQKDMNTKLQMQLVNLAKTTATVEESESESEE